MGPIVLYIHAKNWEDPWNRFGVKSKEVKKHLFGHLIPYNPGLRIFSEKIILLKQRALLFSTIMQIIGMILKAVLK